ncbi:MAG: M28 family metallopeptidase [Runella sp.]
MDSASSTFLQQLTAFPHRGAGSKYEPKAAKIISNELIGQGFKVDFQPFSTPANYVSIVYWLIGGLLCGLLTVQWLGIWAVLITAFFAINGLLYFDWRPSWLIFLPPLVKSHNIIGKADSLKEPKQKLILMAHYDTAPVSALYRRQTPDSFRNTIRLSMLLMALAVVVAGLSFHLPENIYLLTIKGLLSFYFIAQAILGTIGYWQKGYTNGASDNATGVVAALATAQRLRPHLQHTQLEVVLTSAEEAGMIGAYHYWKNLQKSKPIILKERTFLINFDTLGNGNLKLITQTGSMSLIEYNNVVTETAQKIIREEKKFNHVTTGVWHTADFDSVWFVRDGYPCVTLAALDTQGTMPNIHRPEDTLDHVDTRPMLEAILLAEAIALRLDSTPALHS